MRIALLLALALPVAADALEPWTTHDTAAEAAFLGLAAIDWAQTRTALADGAVENNPILGAHPSPARLNLMVGAAAIGHALIARLLPQPYRIIWQYAAIGAEVGTVSSNHFVAGVRIRF